MSYLAKPNSFHMTDQKIQDHMDKQAKQRELRAQLDGQLASRQSVDHHQHGMMGHNPNGPNGGGGYPSQAQGPAHSQGLTKTQMKRIQINKEREMEATMQRTQQLQGGLAQAPHNGLYHVENTAQQQRPSAPSHHLQQGSGYNYPGSMSGTGAGGPSPHAPPSSHGFHAPPSSHGVQASHQQRLLNNHPLRGSSSQQQYGHQQPQQQPDFGGTFGQQPQQQQPHHGHYDQPEVSLSEPVYGRGGGSALPQLPTGRQQPQQGFQGTFEAPPSQHKQRGPAPMTAPYEVEESIYAMGDQKEKENARHKELMSLVGRVQPVEAVPTSGRGGRGGPAPEEVASQRQMDRPANPQRNGGKRGGERGRVEEVSPGVGCHQARRSESREVVKESRGAFGSRQQQRSESKDPAKDKRREDNAANAKQQKLQKELVSHQTAIEKMREKEKNWENQVAKLKQELRQAKTKEKHGGGARPAHHRAETAPNDSVKTRDQLRGAPSAPVKTAPTKAQKKTHHVTPLSGEEVTSPVDFNQAVRYSQDKPFRPITAPNLDSVHMGSGGPAPELEQKSAPPLPPLMSSKAFEGTYTGGQNVSSGPPPERLNRSPLNNVANSPAFVNPDPPISPPKTKASKKRQPVENTPKKEAPPVAPAPTTMMDSRQLRGMVNSGVVTAKQAENLWELFTGERINVAPTPPLVAPPSAGGTYSRPSRGASNPGGGSNVETYETFDTFGGGEPERFKLEEEDADEEDEEEEDEEEEDDEEEEEEEELDEDEVNPHRRR